MSPLLRSIIILAASLLPSYSYAREPVSKLPVHSHVISGYDNPDSVRKAMQMRPLHKIEGIWTFPSDGGSIAIERHTDNTLRGEDDAIRYRMVVMRSPCRSLRPGTLMGCISATARPGIYAAEIYTSGNGGATLRNPKRFTLTLIDDAHLTFRQHSRRIKVNLWRLIPYMSRISVRLTDSDAPKDIDGCIRMFPRPLSGPVEPRYL